MFAAFGLQRGTLMQLIGPTVWWRGLVALLKGNFVGKPSGNETQMPGAFLVKGRSIVWQHRARHAGDHPKLAAAMAALNPGAAPAEQPGKQPAKQANKKASSAALKKLNAEHLKLLTAARDLQRNGDIQGFAAMTARAEEVALQIDAATQQTS